MVSQEKAALSTFEIENEVQKLDDVKDSQLIDNIYKYNSEEQEAILEKSPWKKEYVLQLCLFTC